MQSNTPYVIYRDVTTGLPFKTIQDYIRLEFTRIENDYGYLYLDLPMSYNYYDFKTDGRIEIWRNSSLGVSSLFCETVYFIRLSRVKTDENGKKFIHIIAYDANEILNRRVVAYPESADSNDLTTSKVIKSGYADDMMKQIVRENYSSSATDAARQISSNYFSVQVDTSLGYSLKKRFEYRKILPLLQEIAEDSTLNGTYLVFDMFPVSHTSLEFRTYTKCRGVDRSKSSSSPLIFNMDRGNLSYASITNDATEEYNYIYCGSRDGDVLVTAYDEARMNISTWNRREDWEDATGDDIKNTAQAEADHRLLTAQAKLTINSHIVSLPGTAMGVDINFGDIITINYSDASLDVHMDRLRYLIQGSREEVSIFGRNLDENFI